MLCQRELLYKKPIILLPEVVISGNNITSLTCFWHDDKIVTNKIIRLTFFIYAFYNDAQRTRLAVVWGFEIRLPVTDAWLCFVVEVKNFCLALFVKPRTEAK